MAMHARRGRESTPQLRPNRLHAEPRWSWQQLRRCHIGLRVAARRGVVAEIHGGVISPAAAAGIPIGSWRREVPRGTSRIGVDLVSRPYAPNRPPPRRSDGAVWKHAGGFIYPAPAADIPIGSDASVPRGTSPNEAHLVSRPGPRIGLRVTTQSGRGLSTYAAAPSTGRPQRRSHQAPHQTRATSNVAEGGQTWRRR